MKTKVKSIDIQAKEWWDRANGNSYFSAVVTVNFGLPSIQTFYLPFQYGYGSQYVDESVRLLKLNKLVPDVSMLELGLYFKDNNVRFNYSKHEGCKSAEVQAWGQE